METKKISGIRLPPPVLDEFDLVAEKFGSKQRWMVATAAVLALLKLPNEERDQLIQAAGAADINDSFPKLIAEAKSKSCDNRPPHEVALAKKRQSKKSTQKKTKQK